MNIKIFQATLAQANEISALCATMGYEATPREVRDRLEKILSHDDHRFFVANNDGQIVGFCHGYLRILAEVPEAIEIGGLAVSDSAQGKGVGRSLVAAVEEWAREMGIKTVVLSSNIKRTEAHDFYKHVGYTTQKQQYAFHKDIS